MMINQTVFLLTMSFYTFNPLSVKSPFQKSLFFVCANFYFVRLSLTIGLT